MIKKSIVEQAYQAGSWLAWRAVDMALGAGIICVFMETI
jgi:hypothetical protein